MSSSPTTVAPILTAPPPTSGAPPGAPPTAHPFKDALAEEWARTANAEGQQKGSRTGDPKQRAAEHGRRDAATGPQTAPISGAAAPPAGEPSLAGKPPALPASGQPPAEPSSTTSAVVPASVLPAPAQAHAVDEGAPGSAPGAPVTEETPVPAGSSTTPHGSPAGTADMPPAPLPAKPAAGETPPAPLSTPSAGADAPAAAPPAPGEAQEAAPPAGQPTLAPNGAPAPTEGSATTSNPGPAAGGHAAPEAPGGHAAPEAPGGDLGAQRLAVPPAPSQAASAARAGEAAVQAAVPLAGAAERLLSSSRSTPRSSAAEQLLAASRPSATVAAGTSEVPQPGIAPPAPAVVAGQAAAAAAPLLGSGVQMQDMIESIHATIELAARQGMSQARISLEPAELGEIRIHLSQTGDGLLARVTAETPAAAQALVAGRAELHQALSSLGTSLLRLDIGSFGSSEGREDRHADAPSRSKGSAGTTDGEESIDAVGGPDESGVVSPQALGELVDVLA
jgi:hypothetical protein